MSTSAHSGSGFPATPCSLPGRGCPATLEGHAVPWVPGRLAASRSISRLVHGAYDLPDQPAERWLTDVAEACACTPGAVICLDSAAHFELLLPGPPYRPTLLVAGDTASGRRSRSAARSVVTTHEGELIVGVVEDVVLGVAVRRTGPARTLVDLARRCRNPSDERVVAEAGRRFLGMGGDLEEMFGIAERLRTPSRTRELLERTRRAQARATS